VLNLPSLLQEDLMCVELEELHQEVRPSLPIFNYIFSCSEQYKRRLTVDLIRFYSERLAALRKALKDQ